MYIARSIDLAGFLGIPEGFRGVPLWIPYDSMVFLGIPEGFLQ